MYEAAWHRSKGFQSSLTQIEHPCVQCHLSVWPSKVYFSDFPAPLVVVIFTVVYMNYSFILLLGLSSSTAYTQSDVLCMCVCRNEEVIVGSDSWVSPWSQCVFQGWLFDLCLNSGSIFPLFTGGVDLLTHSFHWTMLCFVFGSSFGENDLSWQSLRACTYSPSSLSYTSPSQSMFEHDDVPVIPSWYNFLILLSKFSWSLHAHVSLSTSVGLEIQKGQHLKNWAW